MGLRAHLPEWMFRRRRRSFAEDHPMHLPSAQEVGDRRACQGEDPLEAAVNWMRHVIDRDFDSQAQQIKRAVVIVEVGSGRKALTVFTSHRVDVTPVELRGLLSEAMRGQEEMFTRANRHADIDGFVNEALPQLLAALEGPASEAARLKQADLLIRMEADCLKAAAISVDEGVRKAYLEAAEWAEERFKEMEQPSWVEEYKQWAKKTAEEGTS
jgi:hypothetical protein